MATVTACRSGRKFRQGDRGEGDGGLGKKRGQRFRLSTGSTKKMDNSRREERKFLPASQVPVPVCRRKLVFKIER